MNKILTKEHIDQPETDFSKISSPEKSSSSNKLKMSSPRSFTKSRSMTHNSTHQPHNEFFVNLNPEHCCRALEYIITLLASQSLLLLKDPNMSSREKQLIRRDLFPELLLFYEFVRKNILLENKDHLIRMKYGIARMKMRKNDDESNDDYYHSQSGTNKRNLSHISMRVNVMRKQHLSQQIPISSTGLARSSIKAYNSPHSVGAASTRADKLNNKRVMFESDKNSQSDQNEEIEYFDDKEDMIYANQSFVQMVERDYFHVVGIIFSTIQVDD